MGLRYEQFEVEPAGEGAWAVVGVGSDGLREILFRTADEAQARQTARLLTNSGNVHGIAEQLRTLVWQIRKQPVTDPSIPDDPTLLADVNRLLQELEGTVPEPEPRDGG